jgi:hypothetical protein
MVNKTLLIAIFQLLLVIGLANAASMTVSSVDVLTDKPQEVDMYSLTLEVEYSAAASSNCRAKVSSLPSGWNVRDGYDTNYKSLDSCTGSTTFDIMPTSIVESPSIVIEVTGTDANGDALTPGTGSPQTTQIEIKNQPTLDVAITSIDSSVSKGGTFSVGYTLQNTGDSNTAATESAAIVVSSSPSAAITTSSISVSSSIDPGQTISGTATLSVTSSSLATNDITVTLTASASNTVQTDAASDSTTCTNCYTSDGGNGGDDGEGGDTVVMGPAPADNETVDDNETGVNETPPGLNKTKNIVIPPGVGLRDNEKLQAAIEKVLAMGKMSDQAKAHLMALSQAISADIEVSRHLTSDNGTSKFTTRLKYKGQKKFTNFIVYENIPKDFSLTADVITVNAGNGRVEVVEADPEFAIFFDKLLPGDDLTITYTVDYEVPESVIDDVRTEVYGGEEIVDEDIGPIGGGTGTEFFKKNKLWFILGMMVIIIAVAIMVISGIRQTKKKQGVSHHEGAHHPVHKEEGHHKEHPHHEAHKPEEKKPEHHEEHKPENPQPEHHEEHKPEGQ